MGMNGQRSQADKVVQILKDDGYIDSSTTFWQAYRAHPGARIALIFLVVLTMAALLAPWLTLYDPSEQFRDYRLTPPVWTSGGWVYFPLGTDELGRDILSRLIYGARLSLMIGLVSVTCSFLPGTVLGLIAAFHSKIIGPFIMRLMDMIMALPSFLLAVAIVAMLGPGLSNTMLAISIVSLPSYVRLAHAYALSEINRDYVIASRLAGAGPLRLMFNTVLPNCLPPLVVQATLGFSSAILDAAALGFLGLGVQPPLPEWGTMLSAARDYIEHAWWVVTMPGMSILLTVLVLNLVGDGLRDALDPKLKKTL